MPSGDVGFNKIPMWAGAARFGRVCAEEPGMVVMVEERLRDCGVAVSAGAGASIEGVRAFRRHWVGGLSDVGCVVCYNRRPYVVGF
jgi:hypothetical protein